MPSCKLFARLMSASSLVLFGLASSAMADISPIDPHALFASGGDADPLGDGGAQIVLSSPGTVGSTSKTGGGIFVFQNTTGRDLTAIDVDITLPDSFGIFIFTGTIISNVPGGTTITTGVDPSGPCDPSQPAASFCVELGFSASPGPIVPIGGTFIIDFDTPQLQGPPPVYGGVDELVANGNYTPAGCAASGLPNCTGDTDNSVNRIGEWSQGAVGEVTPVFATPEPRQYAGLLAGIFAVAIFLKRRRYARA